MICSLFCAWSVYGGCHVFLNPSCDPNSRHLAWNLGTWRSLEDYEPTEQEILDYPEWCSLQIASQTCTAAAHCLLDSGCNIWLVRMYVISQVSSVIFIFFLKNRYLSSNSCRLGMDADADKDLMWIARAGLTACHLQNLAAGSLWELERIYKIPFGILW